MNFRPLRRRDRPEVNLIAFIDVLLVMVIFLTVSARFDRFGALQLRLPEAAADAPARQPCRIAVAVNADGTVMVDRQRVAGDTHGLAQALSGAAQGDSACQLELSADALATHQSVMHVLEAASRAGLPALSFSTRNGAAD